MLTIAAAKAARPQNRAYKMFDGHGLFLFVAPSGLKSWRLKYRHAGKEKLLTFGRYPEMSVADARAQRESARLKIRDGIDPAAVISSESFEPIARQWIEVQRPRWSDSHAGDVLSSLERDVFPEIGQRSVTAISATDVLKIIGRIEKRECIPTARRLRQRLSAIFRYAISQELAEKDPAAIVDQAMMPAPLARPQVALTSIDDARKLMIEADRIDALQSIRLASRFLALTAVRMDSMRGARWEEFAYLETENRIWLVPPERMKLSTAKKQEKRFAHIVPLSNPALKVLRAAANMQSGRANLHATGADFPKSGLVFPGRDPRRPIGAGSIRALYVRAGFGGRHVPHGWRATFSTVMNEDMPEKRAAIDLALAHTPKDRVEAAYNRSVMLTERRQIFDRWGELLSRPA